jgi:hypothetical protein
MYSLCLRDGWLENTTIELSKMHTCILCMQHLHTTSICRESSSIANVAIENLYGDEQMTDKTDCFTPCTCMQDKYSSGQ